MRPALRFENSGHSVAIGRIGREPINGLGGNSDEFAFGKRRSCRLDCLVVCRKDECQSCLRSRGLSIHAVAACKRRFSTLRCSRTKMYAALRCSKTTIFASP